MLQNDNLSEHHSQGLFSARCAADLKDLDGFRQNQFAIDTLFREESDHAVTGKQFPQFLKTADASVTDVVETVIAECNRTFRSISGSMNLLSDAKSCRLTIPANLVILSLVIRFRTPTRTGTAGGPAGPPLILHWKTAMIKPYLNYSDQINLLSQSKGLIIADVQYATQMLTDIGYFSLIGGYKTPFINPMTRKYEISTTFEDVVALYQFDKSLRSLTFDYLNIVEQKIGQLISDAFCSYFGEQQAAYLDPNNYSHKASNVKMVSGLINILDRIANRSSDHNYIVHQRNVHQNVPLWVLRKALTFGQLSKMYSVLQVQQQRAIAGVYGHFSEKQLASALSCLTYFRNVCAHNERLYSFRILQHDFPNTQLQAS